LNEQTLQTLIPPFTLQLLIENCLKHNIVSLNKPLHIKVYEENEQIVVENQIQLKKAEDSLGVGLKNVELRYSRLLDKRVEIVNDQQTFKIKLPLIYEHSHH
jgi:LytS/YehU family sensor histidine kinase